MSSRIAEIGDIDITQYKGEGEGLNSIKLQLSGSHGYVPLSQEEIYSLIIELTKWLQEINRRKAAKVSEDIKLYKELEQTLYQDAKECAHYIQDLELLKIPLYLLNMTNGG